MSTDDRLTYTFGPFELEAFEKRLLCRGREVQLTPRVFDVLQLLVERGGQLVEREALLAEVWRGAFVEEASVSRAISVLRKILEDGDGTIDYIETVPKRGYRFVAPVSRSHRATETAIPPAGRRSSWRRAGIAAFIALAVALGAAAVHKFTPPGSPHRPEAPSHQQVTFTGKEGTPSLSRDGKYVAYVSLESSLRRVMVHELGNGDPVSVFQAPEIGNVRWSPDGSALLFWSRGPEGGGVYVIPRLGGAPRQVVPGVFLACWSPDGSTVAVARYLAGKISFFDTLGHEVRTIALENVKRWISDLDWSPVNQRLLFVSNDDGGNFLVSSINPDGTDQRTVVRSSVEVSAARWTPGGDGIYYFRKAGQTVSLFRTTLDGEETGSPEAGTPLLTGMEADGSFGLSGDGNRLVYARAPFHSNLWSVRRSLSEGNPTIDKTQLTEGTSLVERPRISPDGRHVLFNMGRETSSELYTVSLSGGAAKRLTFLNSFSLGGAWSADGHQVAFASTLGGKPQVWLIGTDGNNPTAISSGDMSDSFEISWSPASTILYQQIRNRNFYVLNPQTHEEQFLLDNDGPQGWIFSPVPSGDGRLAIAWNRQPDHGLWIFDPATHEGRRIYKESIPTPVGWSPNGDTVYAIEGKRAAYRGVAVYLGETTTQARILEIATDGSGVRSILELPFEEVGGVAVAPDGRTFVCAVYTSRSDVWIAEHFDR